MKTKILIEIIDNKIIFRLSLNINLIDYNTDSYNDLDETIIYECENLDIDFYELYKNIDKINNKLKDSFPGINEFLDKNNLIFFTNDNDFNVSIFSFIKKYKNLNVLISVDNYKSLVENLKDEDYPNLKILFNNSEEAVYYKDFYLMFSKLNEIIKFINHYNLSPLEKVLLVYDIVKANEYNEENKNEDYSTSRNLNRIINSDKIVCVGFSNLIDFLLTNLGFECNKISLEYKDKDFGHQRNFIKLKDDKYGIDGIFFLDATWDSKRDEKYLDNYYCFLKPITFFRRIKPNEIIETPKRFKLFNQTKEEILEKIKNNNNFDFINLSVNVSMLLKIIDNKQSFITLFQDDFERNEKLLNKIFKYFSQKIDEEAFKNALYKVRRIEYINNIIEYEPNEEYINSVCEKIYGKSAEDRLLKLIFGNDEPTLDTDLEEIGAESVEQDLLRIRFLKALKTKLNDFPDNDYIKKM